MPHPPLFECPECGRVFEHEIALVFCCNPRYADLRGDRRADAK